MEKVLIEIEMENGDVMKGELYPEVAPITVENFLKYPWIYDSRWRIHKRF